MQPGLYKLTIDNPCQEFWQEMQANETGRHCSKCSTTVLDFTSLSDTEIQNFFLQNNYKPVCGRFKNHQLNRVCINIPRHVLSKSIPFWKKFLIIFLFCFGSQLYPFDTYIDNNSALHAQTTKKKSKSNKKRGTDVKLKKKLLTKPIDINIEHIVLGFTYAKRTDENILTNSSIKLTSESFSQKDTVVSQLPVLSTNNGKKKPKEKKSIQKMELMLPSALVRRRKKRR